MGVRTLFIAAILTGLLFASRVLGQVDMVCHFDNIVCKAELGGQSAGNWAAALRAAIKAKTEFNQNIADARAKFFALYPDKPGIADATKIFMDLLQQKDIWYLQLALEYSTLRIGNRPGETVPNFVDLIAGGQQMDNGIRPISKDEFNLWVMKVRGRLGPITPGTGQAMYALSADDRVARILEETREEYARYLEMRDNWEFVTAGKTLPAYIVPKEYNTKNKYGEFLYFRFGGVPIADAEPTYAQMVKLLGAGVVESSAEQVRLAPKNPTGTQLVVTTKPPRHYWPRWYDGAGSHRARVRQGNWCVCGTALRLRNAGHAGRRSALSARFARE